MYDRKSLNKICPMIIVNGRRGREIQTWISVTRLGDLLHFGQPFKACGKNYFAQIAHIFRIFLLSFASEIIFGQLLPSGIWRFFTNDTDPDDDFCKF